MENWYWIGEYSKVLMAYVFLMFVYPSILFRSYLRGKNRTFWFGFCVCGQVVLISTVVLMLGVCHVLNAWLLRGLFYGSLLWSLLHHVRLKMTPQYFVYKYGMGTYGLKLLLLRIRQSFYRLLSRAASGIKAWVKRDVIELITLALLVSYGILYFSWGPLHSQFFGFGDIPVHFSWIRGLKEGKIFSSGIYPEGMHCVAYAVSELFGIRLYSVIQFLQCIHVGSFLIAAYLLARELFVWKYTALLGLALFLSLKHGSFTLVTLMSHLQVALPQSFGMTDIPLITLFLIRYLKKKGPTAVQGRKTKCWWDENLLVFLLGISASLACHFYTTIMAVFTCMGVALIWCTRLFHWRRLVPVVSAALLALMIAVTPMALAFAQGTPLQGSLYWALEVMEKKPQDSWEQFAETQQSAGQEVPTVSGQTGQEHIPVQQQMPQSNLRKELRKNLNGIFTGGFMALFSDSWSRAMVWLSAAALALPLLCRMVFGLLRKKKLRFRADLLDGYALLAVMSLVLMLALSSGSTVFPTIISSERVFSITYMFYLFLAVFPMDILGALLSLAAGCLGSQALGALGAAAVFAVVIQTGNYHGYLYRNANRFDVAVNVTNAIIANFPEKQFTIISPTEELYQTVDYGFHEELLTMLDKKENAEYYIPTKYLFFYLEKKPIVFNSANYTDGPSWLALQRYHKLLINSSVGKDYETGEISEEKAELPLLLGSKLSNGYSNIYNREIVESRAWKYMEILLERYPDQISVFYEDDNFICYCMKQNPLRLTNLSGLDT